MESTYCVCTNSVLPYSDLFFCGEIARGLEAKQALELQTVSQAERQRPLTCMCYLPPPDDLWVSLHGVWKSVRCYWSLLCKKGPTCFMWCLKNG